MSYTAKQLIRVARKRGYQVKEGGKHTLIYDPATGRRISTIPRGYTHLESAPDEPSGS